MDSGSHESTEQGFTLIELLVVILIIAILAAIAIPVYLNQRNKGYDAATKSDLRNAASAQESYLADHYVYATTLTELQTEGFLLSRNDASFFVISVHPDATNDAKGTYCLSARSNSGTSFYYDSGAGTGVSTTACT